MQETPERSSLSEAPSSQVAPPAQAGAAPDHTARRQPPWRRRWWLFAGVLAAAAAAGVYAVHYFSYASTHPNTDDATIGGETISINSKLAARVSQVHVNGDQRVSAGQLLVTLVPADAQAQESQAAAAAAQAIAAEGQVRSAQANVVSAAANATKAGRDYVRFQELYRAGAVAAMQLDAASAAQQTADAQYRAALATSRGGDPVAAQRQAAVLANNVINGQAAVLAFDHAFQIVVIAVLAMVVCVPFFRVPRGARGARIH